MGSLGDRDKKEIIIHKNTKPLDVVTVDQARNSCQRP